MFPEFKSGEVSGGWFTLAYLALNIACLAFFKRGAIKRLTSRPSNLSLRMRRYIWVQTQLFFAPMAYAAWLPVRPSSLSFQIGTTIFTIGMLAYAAGMITFGRANVDSPIRTGVYRYSRHPHYVSSFIAWMGASLAMQSLVVPAAWLLLFAMMHRTNKIEEQACLEQYGDAYREYMNQTPRYLLLK